MKTVTKISSDVCETFHHLVTEKKCAPNFFCKMQRNSGIFCFRTYKFHRIKNSDNPVNFPGNYPDQRQNDDANQKINEDRLPHDPPTIVKSQIFRPFYVLKISANGDKSQKNQQNRIQKADKQIVSVFYSTKKNKN